MEGVRSGGRRSPRSPENSALALHMLHMLLMPRMPKAYDVFFKNHQVSFRRMSRSSACFFSSNQRILKSESARNFRKMPICEISNQKEPIFFQENRLLCFICFLRFLCLVCLLCRGLRRSRPSALPSITYRGFAVAPMTLRAPSRRFLYNSGCRTYEKNFGATSLSTFTANQPAIPAR